MPVLEINKKFNNRITANKTDFDTIEFNCKSDRSSHQLIISKDYLKQITIRKNVHDISMNCNKDCVVISRRFEQVAKYKTIFNNEIVEITLDEDSKNQFIKEFEKFIKIVNDFKDKKRTLNDNELSKLSYEELYNISLYPDLYKFNNANLGLDEIFRNENLIKMQDDTIIKLLDLLKSRGQRFFDYSTFEVLKHSKKVREWALENMKMISSNELYIEDKYTF